MTSLLLSLMMGMVLGQRYRVLVLLPAGALILLVMVSVGLARAQGLESTALTAAAAIVSLQIGYLAGSGLRRYFFAAARLRSVPRGASATVSRSAPSSAL
jgi:hypothetical protein